MLAALLIHHHHVIHATATQSIDPRWQRGRLRIAGYQRLNLTAFGPVTTARMQGCQGLHKGGFNPGQIIAGSAFFDVEIGRHDNKVKSRHTRHHCGQRSRVERQQQTILQGHAVIILFIQPRSDARVK